MSAAALTLCPVLAHAQDATTAQTWVGELIVTGAHNSFAAPVAATATRTATPVEEIPQSIQILTRTLIDEQDLQNISNALVNVSGVTPSSTMQIVLQAPLIRGFAVNYYYDGLPAYGLPAGITDPATLINAERIAAMKPGAFLINVSRGPLIDTEALIAALESGALSGAGLDVVEGEPNPPRALVDRADVIVTPHIAFSSEASLAELRRRSAEEVVRVLSGEAPHFPCNRPEAKP